MKLLGFCIAWVLVATAVAFLPMRYQYAPGIALLLAAPVLIWLLALEFGFVPAGLAFLALTSMFRKPLRYFGMRALGHKPEVPK
jgi:hypothetical protein